MLISAALPSARALPPAPSRDTTPPADSFSPDTPDKVVVFPALNPVLLKQMEFDVELCALSNSALSAPIHLSAGAAQGDINYDLPFNSAVMEGRGQFDGQDFQETWRFGSQTRIDGHLGKVEEHLVLTYDDQGLHVRGQVAGLAVTRDIAPKGEGYTVNGSLGQSQEHQEFQSTPADSNGSWRTTMQAGQSSASADFATLKDRHRVAAQGQNPTLQWAAGADLIFIPDPNAPPPDNS